MTSLKLAKGNFPQTITLPRSKSYANRALILGALKTEPFTVSRLPGSSDVTWLLSALENCGLKLQRQEDSVTVLNHFPACENNGATIEVGEGGTTARFLASLLVRGKRPYTLVLGGRLKERPWSEFIAFVKKYGGQAELVNDELRVQGPLKLPAKVEVDCSRTTQFASGLLLAFSDACQIVPQNLSASRSYWEMSLAVLEAGQKTHSFEVPLDWSSASYPLAFGALNHQIFFPGLVYDQHQSDARFLDILKDLGAIRIEEAGIHVLPIKDSRSLDLDVRNCLDLVPALVFLLAHVAGEHQLRGVENLVHKESDRLAELRKLLDQFGRSNTYVSGVLTLQGRAELVKDRMTLSMANDHRMVMTAALFLRHHFGGTVAPVEAVDKSYPHFFDMLL